MPNIKPALTPQEWAAGEVRGLRFAEAGGGMLVLVHNELGCDADITLLRDERHAAAAVLLHGQPYGFTRADVELIRDFARELDATMNGLGGGAVAHDLADRIAALLPPD